MVAALTEDDMNAILGALCFVMMSLMGDCIGSGAARGPAVRNIEGRGGEDGRGTGEWTGGGPGWTPVVSGGRASPSFSVVLYSTD